MDILGLYRDYGIDHSTSHKNVRSGWVGTDCPFCGSEGKYHLGYELQEEYFSCWNCGGHSIPNAISKILNVSTSKAEEIIEQYGGKSRQHEEAKVKIGKRRFKLPMVSTFNSLSWTYLKDRGFDDPDKIIEEWHLHYTGPYSTLDGINYSFRVLAPIYWNGRMVSFQARSISPSHPMKYMACPPERERISHKHILYGQQDKWGRRGICVEGIVDAWRFGVNSFATFGVKFTRQQLIQMAEHFDEIAVAYDPEPAAQSQAKRLIYELNFKGVTAWIVDLPSDPGDMKQSEADELVKSILSFKPK